MRGEESGFKQRGTVYDVCRLWPNRCNSLCGIEAQESGHLCTRACLAGTVSRRGVATKGVREKKTARGLPQSGRRQALRTAAKQEAVCVPSEIVAKTRLKIKGLAE